MRQTHDWALDNRGEGGRSPRSQFLNLDTLRVQHSLGNQVQCSFYNYYNCGGSPLFLVALCLSVSARARLCTNHIYA